MAQRLARVPLAPPHVRPRLGDALLLVRGRGVRGESVGLFANAAGSWQESGAEAPTPRGA
ncbi:hypothetical protein SMICM17S_07443 [Streptomyces microflavus]